MPQIIEKEGEYTLTLTLNKSFIEKYELHKKLAHPNFDFLFHSYDSEGNMTFPFTFPQFIKTYDRNYLEAFVEHLVKLVPPSSHSDQHIDNLLFLANSLYFQSYQKVNRNLKDDFLRRRAKVLLDLIKVPIPEINKINVFTYMEDDDELKTYIQVASYNHADLGKPTNGVFTLEDVSDNIWDRTFQLIKKDKNISVELLPGKYLTISKDIGLEFVNNTSKSILFGDKGQRPGFIKSIVKDILEEQKINNTLFYQSLLTGDISAPNYFKKLGTTVGNYPKNKFRTALLKNLFDLLMSYFKEEHIVFSPSKNINSRKQKDCIYQYFLILGLFLNKSGEITTYVKEEELLESLKIFKSQLLKNANFSINYFNDTFKNLKRTHQI